MNPFFRSIPIAILACIIALNFAFAQEIQPIYDESKIPDYTLPDPLVTSDGKKVKSAEHWLSSRRAEILQVFEEEVYGKNPEGSIDARFEVLSEDPDALFGKAIRREIRLFFSRNDKEVKMDLLMYLPKSNTKTSFPVFIGLNFNGNHTINRDPEITITDSWVRNNEEMGVTVHHATTSSRGAASHRWPVEKIIEKGYGLATIYYGDIDPDFNDGFQNGIHPLFYKDGQTKPDKNEWGSIGAWAWGLSRAMDYFETDPVIDSKKVVVIGHSRLGKTSLWAGALDERFAIVISNDSGCGGAALSRRRFGESVRRINTSFPHWFCDNFNKYNDNEDDLSVDQHMLISLIAPRPVYVASAEEDRWADPKGEFLSLKYSSNVYKLLGRKDFAVKNMPAVGFPVTGIMGYHIRPGKHDITLYDWEQYLTFADLHFNKTGK